MLFRFSLYGFLKNQRYYEPFLVLAFLEKGLSFLQIGILIAFREICVNLLEIPSGALADVGGRRLSMMLSFSAYLISFLTFGFSDSYNILFLAMFLFSIGDAFRTGTHKAMIFAWLRQQGMEDERTRIYGYTRSWSKRGSAVSVVLAAVFVFYSENYSWVFFFSAIPCLFSMINMAGYPADLEGRADNKAPSAVWQHMREAFRTTWRQKPLRRILAESMGFEGSFTATKDYLQPILKAQALALTGILAFTADWSQAQQSAVLVGAVYFLLHLLSATASQNAHKFLDAAGGPAKASQRMWFIFALLAVILLVAGWQEWTGVLIAAFVVFHIVQNFWRPILIGRMDDHADADYGATVMSLESQSKRLATVLLAPLLGWLVDLAAAQSGEPTYWPLGAVMLPIACLFLLQSGKKSVS